MISRQGSLSLSPTSTITQHRTVKQVASESKLNEQKQANKNDDFSLIRVNTFGKNNDLAELLAEDSESLEKSVIRRG